MAEAKRTKYSHLFSLRQRYSTTCNRCYFFALLWPKQNARNIRIYFPSDRGILLPLKKTPKVKTAPPTDPIEQLLQASARSQRQAVGDRSSDDSTDDWNPVDYDGL